jgi:ABC-type glutathione transport system ATPase component
MEADDEVSIMQGINTQLLPKEIRDVLELKSMSDQSFYRALEEDYTDIMFETLNSRSQVDSRHSMIISFSGTQGSGKSYASIAICKTLDPNFSVDQIYFNYNDLVYNKSKLKPGMAVLVDEQSDAFGMDSHRVNIILSALKEQLRKKSIHFVFCSPTLKSEYESSMYVLETMFLDFETQECYAAYKTRELLTLGYVRIPNPLSAKIGITKEFMEAYEAKKD